MSVLSVILNTVFDEGDLFKYLNCVRHADRQYKNLSNIYEYRMLLPKDFDPPRRYLGPLSGDGP